MTSILAGSTALGRFLAGVLLRKINWFYVLVGCLALAALLVCVAMPLAKEAAGKTYTGWGDAPLAAFAFPLIGLFLALIVGFCLDRYPFITLPDSYYVTQLPVALDCTMVVTIFVIVLLLSLLAAWLPARKTRKIALSDLLRFDG